MTEQKKTFLGIELGSTRIKAVLIDENYKPVASGEHSWENRLENGVWTYALEDIWAGLRDSFQKLRGDFKNKFGVPLTDVGAMGVSAMMHGYMAFDEKNNLLVPFRTWRNTTTEQAANKLSALFDFNIPQRWSIAHLYQAVLNNEPHVKDISFVTTLAGYVHWMLTGEKVLGVGDASGMFPIENGNYNAGMGEKFFSIFKNFKIENIFPKVINAGAPAGNLTKEGARLLDPSGEFSCGAPLCPPEGDAGTGMVATNSVTERAGNVSAGTSVFAMIVLEKNLKKNYPEIDIVTTPTGKPVAMVHCNNCTSDLDAWVNMFDGTLSLFGARVEKSELYGKLYNSALDAEADCAGLLSYNYFSGEPIAGLDEGRPLFARTPEARFTVSNLMRSLLFSAMATLRLGMDILSEENIRLERLLGHGGFFKTKGVGQKLMAAALNAPVYVMESAGEGGAWGIALLAAYMKNSEATLEDFLSKKVFANAKPICETPCPGDVTGFNTFLQRYKKGLAIEKSAVEAM